MREESADMRSGERLRLSSSQRRTLDRDFMQLRIPVAWRMDTRRRAEEKRSLDTWTDSA